jgi:hypothetical protein
MNRFDEAVVDLIADVPSGPGIDGLRKRARRHQRRRVIGVVAVLSAIAVASISVAASLDKRTNNSVAVAASSTTTPSTSVPTGPPPAEGQAEAAVWFIKSNKDVTSASRTFTAYVSRLGCNGGVTGKVLQPTIQKSDTRIVVTFTVEAAPPGFHTCQGNDRVPMLVDLGEALGDRQLVDGACRSGAEAATTAFCVDGSVRWSR